MHLSPKSKMLVTCENFSLNSLSIAHTLSWWVSSQVAWKPNISFAEQYFILWAGNGERKRKLTFGKTKVLLLLLLLLPADSPFRTSYYTSYNLFTFFIESKTGLYVSGAQKFDASCPSIWKDVEMTLLITFHNIHLPLIHISLRSHE